MAPLFEKYHIKVFALSKDTPEQTRAHAKVDQLDTITLLSDPKMNVIKAFGLEHQKALEFATWKILGLPLGVPTGFKTMAIPTTLLIDEEGIVRWIDQAEDYRQRGDEQRIKQAIEAIFSS